MIVLDTTVLVHAVGSDHDLRNPCRTLIESVGDGRVAATSTVEVAQEFAHVRARRRSREDAVALARAYVDLLAPLLPVTEEDVRAALELFQRHDALGSFDALVAASALRLGAGLVSADTAFGRIPGLEHVVPDAAGVAQLLSTA